jgi:hypothetical protein
MLNPPRRAILSRAHNTLAPSMLTVRRRRIGSAALKGRLFTFSVIDKRPVRVSSRDSLFEVRLFRNCPSPPDPKKISGEFFGGWLITGC